MARRPALVVALLGAESTGKTTLARALAEALAHETGEAATWVPETLLEWCEAAGRTPRADEQLAIAQAQHARAVAGLVAGEDEVPVRPGTGGQMKTRQRHARLFARPGGLGNGLEFPFAPAGPAPTLSLPQTPPLNHHAHLRLPVPDLRP